ncbi:MAG TPA: phospholipase C, phosphocholine-specific [Solirubrobacteraceae bacterium]|jgi:phospholipase C|nr:phospholipase C, phosphocholine-specific [Solirubrobacteraceae bacterium]
MREINRRRFLQLAGGSVAATMLSDSIARALTIPANHATRSIDDIEHVVVLMQENRSFDHYFGVMRGVRGFGDPHPITLPSGKPVWYQADGTTVVPPFRPDVGNLALTFIEDLDHTWDGTHQMFNGGNWDQWLPAKTTTCMAHMKREDLPFHYALADAFTVCDGYHCSMLGPTDTNRYYMWTGWDGNDGQGGGPVIANDELGYGWQTYPERLQQAGVSWKIYQDSGDGLDKAGAWGWTSDPYIGNYGDNSLLYFFNYQNATPGSPLYQAARTGTDVNVSGGFFDILAADVKNGQLPSVSWVVAPEAYTEHPAWPAGYGAWYTAGVLDALTSDPEVWSKTALLITFDENDGFFDHAIGAYPNVGGLAGQSTVPLDNELFNGTAGTPGGTDGVVGPYGLGVRVPLLVVSPWSTGGWVCSETFDHTSLIRFIEQRFSVDEPNITPWRRAVCGDLTSAFDFESASDRVPSLPSVAEYKPNESTTPPSYHPLPPAVGSVPVQEPGVKPSRRLAYRFDVQFNPDPQTLSLSIRNRGQLGVGVQARSLTVAGAPYTYTVGAGDDLSTGLTNPGTYDLSLHGPNGFFRHFAGSPSTQLRVEVHADHELGRLRIRVLDGDGPRARRPGRPIVLAVADAYGPDRRLELVGADEILVDTGHAGGWYDIALSTPSDAGFSYQLAGRLESAARLTSDPQLGRS